MSELCSLFEKSHAHIHFGRCLDKTYFNLQPYMSDSTCCQLCAWRSIANHHRMCCLCVCAGRIKSSSKQALQAISVVWWSSYQGDIHQQSLLVKILPNQPFQIKTRRQASRPSVWWSLRRAVKLHKLPLVWIKFAKISNQVRISDVWRGRAINLWVFKAAPAKKYKGESRRQI